MIKVSLIFKISRGRILSIERTTICLQSAPASGPSHEIEKMWGQKFHRFRSTSLELALYCHSNGQVDNNLQSVTQDTSVSRSSLLMIYVVEQPLRSCLRAWIVGSTNSSLLLLLLLLSSLSLLSLLLLLFMSKC